MKRKKVRTSLYADKETLRLMDQLAHEPKISRSGVAELAILALGRKDSSKPVRKKLPLPANV